MNPLLFPVVAVQGTWVRRRTEILPEASGKRAGSVASPLAPATAKPVRLTVLGESTAAGCGAPTHAEGFAGALADAIAQREGCRVAWTVHGQRGATARRIRHRLLPDVEKNLDIAVLLAGVNDVLARRPTDQWADDLAAILDTLMVRAHRVVVAGLPPFEGFPSLPSTLSRFLGERAEALDEVAKRLCGSRPSVFWIDSRALASSSSDFYASDGFHPSPAGYARWAQAVSEHLAPPTGEATTNTQ